MSTIIPNSMEQKIYNRSQSSPLTVHTCLGLEVAFIFMHTHFIAIAHAVIGLMFVFIGFP